MIILQDKLLTMTYFDEAGEYAVDLSLSLSLSLSLHVRTQGDARTRARAHTRTPTQMFLSGIKLTS